MYEQFLVQYFIGDRANRETPHYERGREERRGFKSRNDEASAERLLILPFCTAFNSSDHANMHPSLLVWEHSAEEKDNHNTIVPALLGIEPNIIKLPND